LIADRRRPQACQPREGDTDVEVITDEVGVVKEYTITARDNHQFAKSNKIGIDRPVTRTRTTSTRPGPPARGHFASPRGGRLPGAKATSVDAPIGYAMRPHSASS
jgi:hypothetical protein